MNVVDIPRPASRGLYDEAASRYAAMVKSRAVAVYGLWRESSAGFSQLAWLVVTDHIGWDNRFFFSALHRLPERYHRFFLHEPYILPGWSLRVMRYTQHRASRLLAGRHVLAAYAPNDEREERWCRLLESYCTYASFAEKTRSSQLLRGREVLSIACALGTLIAQTYPILPEIHDEGYTSAIDTVRRSFFEDGDPVERVRDAWALFENAFDHFDRAVRERLKARDTREAVTTARARLCGDEECDDIDRAYAFRRARDIEGYRHELASLGFPFGDLFSPAAHPQAVRTPAGAPVLDSLLRGVYLVRRRIIDYAAG